MMKSTRQLEVSLLLLLMIAVLGGFEFGQNTVGAFFDERALFLNRFAISDFVILIAGVVVAIGWLTGLIIQKLLLKNKSNILRIIIPVVFSTLLIAGAARLFDGYLESLTFLGTTSHSYHSLFVSFYCFYMLGLALHGFVQYLRKQKMEPGENQ